MIRNQRQHIDVGPTATNRRKVGHVTRACNTCRRKKSKCDGKQPVCKACSESGHECTWTAEEDSRRPATKQYVESLKNTNKHQQERIHQLEALLAANGLSADAVPTELPPTSRGGSPNLLGPLAPVPGTHSPSGSWTGELPPEQFLSAGNDPGYESLSDTESVAENLSNATSRLVINDGGLSMVGPSSTQFHRPSPITRTIPLEDSNEDAPKHTLQIGDDAPPSRSHSRHASFSHTRSRSQSQTRSAVHSRASSVSPHGITPPPQSGQFGAVSPPIPPPFHGLSPPTTGGIGVPYYDPSSPGGDSEHPGTEQYLGASLKGIGSPNPVGDEDDEDQYDWKQMLPQDVDLTRKEHDTLLDLFFKFFSSWCYRTVPDLFLRDMRRYLEGIRTVAVEDPQSPSEEKTMIIGPKTVHYTPMLHNSILSLALAYSDDPILSKRSTRAKFVEKAKSTLEMECSRPSLACVQALAYIASFYSGEGEQTLGFLFFGMSIRMSQALGLSLDCSSWVKSGHISELDAVDRIWTFWTTYSLDKCWAFYVGRDHGLPNPLMKLSQVPPSAASSQSGHLSATSPDPTHRIPMLEIQYPSADEKVDNTPWEWKIPGTWMGQGGTRTMPNVPSNISSAFYQTCKLMVLATKVMNTLWKMPKNTGSEAISQLALEVDQWLEDLPDSMRITRPKTTQALPHILMINMAHQWLQIVLHRPFYRLSQNKADPSIKRCDSGAEKILQYLSAWRRLYGLRYVPITTVQIAFISGTTCLLRAIQSVNMPEKRRGALDGVKEIVRALNEMGRTWKGAQQSAEALRVLLHEQVSAGERSPGPSRHPTVELQPPSVANSRAQTMDMTFELHPGSRGIPIVGNILEESRDVFTEPHSDYHMQVTDGFLSSSPYHAESPRSAQGAQFLPNDGYSGAFEHSTQGYNQYVPEDPNAALGSDLYQVNNMHNNMGLGMAGQNANLGMYPQLDQFIGASDARLRAGESFPNHPAGLFGMAEQTVPAQGSQQAWYGGGGYSFSGVPNQQAQQHQQAFWGQ